MKYYQDSRIIPLFDMLCLPGGAVDIPIVGYIMGEPLYQHQMQNIVMIITITLLFSR
jgi:hypothetical protein